MNVVARVPTVVSQQDALESTRRLWPSVFGEQPSSQALALILALEWIETAQGKRCFNNNAFNVSAGSTYPNDAWRPPWFDFDGGTNVTDRNVQLHEAMLKGNAPSAFRSYTTLDAGVTDGLRVLRKNNASIIAAAKTGDADKFRTELSQLFSPDFSNPHATDTLGTFRDSFLALMGVPVPVNPVSPGNPVQPAPAPAPGVSSGAGMAIGFGVAALAVGIFFATLHPPRMLRAA